MIEHDFKNQLRRIQSAARNLDAAIETLLGMLPVETVKPTHQIRYACEVPGRCTEITGHAVEQYIIRSGNKRGVDQVIKTIKERLSDAEEWELKQQYRVAALIDHGLRVSRYWRHGDMLFVADETLCVTAHKMEAKRWQKKVEASL